MNDRVTGRGQPLFPDEPRTLGELLSGSADKFRLADALNYRDATGWKAISSSEMIAAAEEIGLGLVSLGLSKGDRAAILAPNSQFWTFSDAGCQLTGIIDVPIYTTLAPATVGYILKDSEAKAVFLDSIETFERISGALSECGELDHVIVFDDAAAAAEGVITLKELREKGRHFAAGSPGAVEKMREQIGGADVATLIYTSGTTGEPKGVMLTHNNIISNVIDAGEKFAFSSNDIPLSVLPLSHVFERSAMYLYIYNGMRVHYARSVEKVPEDLPEVRPTIFVGVPRIFEKVYAKAKLKAAQGGGLKERIFDRAIETAKEMALAVGSGTSPTLGLRIRHKIADRIIYRKLREFFGGDLRCCITGGAALSNDISLIFTGAGITIMQGYGLTETSPVVSSNNPETARLGTVGKPIRNVEVRIAADGEIEVRGPGVMGGYYKKPKETAEVFTADGWFKTGDIGALDDDGFLTITDRKKELFKTSGGKYIAPSPIEQMIRSSRFVNQAVLVGNERKFASALIVPNFEMLESYAKHKGFAVMSPSEFCKDARIIDLIERQVQAATKGLARFETVKKIVLLDKEFTIETGELTPTLKLKRRVIDQKYADVIDTMYAGDEV